MSVSRWGSFLRQKLLAGGVQIPEELLARRVDQYYVPVYEQLQRRMEAFRQQQASSSSSVSTTAGVIKRPFFVGISAPQGCGKTTLTDYQQVEH